MRPRVSAAAVAATAASSSRGLLEAVEAGRAWTSILSLSQGGTMVPIPTDPNGYISKVGPVDADDYSSTSVAPVVPPGVALEVDPFLFTSAPTASPSMLPTSGPTSRPTAPTASPTRRPTPAPTRPPTMAPTAAPTPNMWISNPTPADANPGAGYFDYSPPPPCLLRGGSTGCSSGEEEEARYFGPGSVRPLTRYNATHSKYIYERNAWADVSDSDEYRYWVEFQEYMPSGVDLAVNVCGMSGGWDRPSRQSPIDVRGTGAMCREYHEIRHRPGDYRLDHPGVRKLILPSKLRIMWPRSDGGADDKDDGNGNGKPAPPRADMPKGWGHHLDVIHADVRIPSEHLLEGRRYAAKYQLFLVQKKGRGMPAISVLMDLHPQDVPNDHFQVAIEAWGEVYDADVDACQRHGEDGEGRARRAAETKGAEGDGSVEGGEREDIPPAAGAARDGKGGAGPLDEERPEKRGKNEDRRRARLGEGNDGNDDDKLKRWDPFAPGSIMRSVWFYGYEGSITEPPCSEFVEWRVVDSPMLISHSQLRRLKTMLFRHVDPARGCRRTSVHHDGYAARPVQDSTYRAVHRCTCRDFISDDDRDWYGRNRCWDGEEYAFHPFWPRLPPEVPPV